MKGLGKMCTLLIGQRKSDQSEPCRSDLKTTWRLTLLVDVKLYKWLVISGNGVKMRGKNRTLLWQWSIAFNEAHTHEKSDSIVSYLHDSLEVPIVARFRLSAHHLRVETGRWTRTPRQFRVYPCDNVSIQDENHVMFYRPETLDIKEN